MWWDRNLMRRFAVLAAVALAAGGCFQPLYADRAPGGGFTGTSSVRDAMAGIDIASADDRLELEVRNALIYRLTGGGGMSAPTHKLEFQLTRSVQSAVVDRFTSRPETETLTLNAAYVLRQTGIAEPVLRGRVFGSASYDRTRQRYASVRAQRDAEDRAAGVIAEQMAVQIAAHFAKQR